MSTPSFSTLAARSLVLVLALFLALPPAKATSLFKGAPEAVLTADAAAPWEFIERHKDPHPRFPAEPHHPKLVHFYKQIADGFGTKEPHSRYFLLHAMQGWDKATQPRPVLLIPGSNDDATRRYAYPLATVHPDHKKFEGLAQYLAKRGFAVFAISFSHYHGDNLYQGEQVANAISRIRELLGKRSTEDFKVDLVTYSKGAMAARCYVQSAGKMYGLRYLTPYRGDVRKVVFEVPPIGGLDMPFRYYLYNLTCKNTEAPAPLGVTKQLLYGRWVESGIEDIHSGYWPGQLQMIHDQRLVGVPYGPLSWTAADANMTMSAIREGGSTFFVHSHGLEAARQAGGNMIEKLNAAGFPKDVEAVLLAGTHPILYDEHEYRWRKPMGAELSDTSDGLVFLKSATYTKGLTAQGAKVSGKTFPLNHMDVSRKKDVFEFVAGELE